MTTPTHDNQTEAIKTYEGYVESLTENLTRGFGQVIWSLRGRIRDLLDFHRREIMNDFGVCPDKPDIAEIIRKAFDDLEPEY